MRALIIGGGLGGLATAISLRKLGIDCLVLEQTDRLARLQAAGAGLSLWSNAMRVIRDLGVEAQVLAKGSVIERSFTLSPKGRVLAELDVAALGGQAGAPSVCIHRAELYCILAEALPPDVMRSAARCVSFAVRGDMVIAHMSDGAIVNGDFLIGADGINSAVRKQLLGLGELRYAGYTCWRGLAEGPWADGGQAFLGLGSGVQSGLFPCGPGRVYWYATHNLAPKAALELSTVLDLFPEAVRAAIQATPSHAILRNDICDRAPSQNWGTGPVTLLGDAAHPATPNLGQGACQALEDAVAIAKCFEAANSIEEALRAYERTRMPRTAMVNVESWRAGAVLQSENPILMVLRDLLVASPAGHILTQRLMKKLLCVPNKT